ncbi:pyridoxamine 5'-phosphate oxidase family protein [Marinobacterium arenosum]|uniref:pyridoxamine 5'-phosphate oxidase family protein n=1 Tax=Marinobacterium arenosum TaxID=2862496 RepID=UPI001C95D443|nr:pyridoxamine 5'-phosphate oxidase family protein [Marinobacterium arenosum]MBY4678583.1 pyridoxamine 5'-phosphate oxidase family protein [Marinobacterium arenosum]
MGQQFDALTDHQIDFIQTQKLFFVGTAAQSGKVNVSPKGMDSLRILNNRQVLWLNITGSGNETSAHVQQLPRMTLMFCAFEGAPEIIRLYGQAQVLHRGHPDWPELIRHFADTRGARQLFLLDIELVQSSCGMSIPFFEYVGERDALKRWAEKKGEAGIEKYWADRNQRSLDGAETHILALTGLADDQV